MITHNCRLQLDLRELLKRGNGLFGSAEMTGVYWGCYTEHGEACKNFVKTIVSNYKMPYITITPTFSVCDEHDYLNGEQKTCPICNKKTKVWTRVMGYFRPVDSFNTGKQGEYKERVMYKE